MKIGVHRHYIGLMILITTLGTINGYKALVIVPVADLVGQPLNSPQKYEQLPFSPVKNHDYSSCSRTHQLLFNETVTIIKESNDQAYIAISHLCHRIPSDSSLHTTYWTLKKNLIPFKELEQNKIDTNIIPPAINFNDKTSVHNPSVITLTTPFYDPITQQTFSAGTRFVQDTNKSMDHTIAVYCIDYVHRTVKILSIPKTYCNNSTTTTSHEQSIRSFIELLRQWANLPKGFIPYVQGGYSFVKVQTNDTFVTHTTMINNNIVAFFERIDDAQSPKTGFDCTGLIACAAQMCTIPYFFKNTTTIAHYLKPLNYNEQLQEGDLIWILGHVMVVANMSKNTLIEARSYEHGYGKVHEIALHKVFKDMHTFKDLMIAYTYHKPLQRLHKNGNVMDTFKNFKLLKLASAWDITL